MGREPILSEEQLDYLLEVLNIGAGNAAGALEQLLGRRIEMRMTEMHFVTVAELCSLFDDVYLPFAAVKMGLVDDMRGDLIFMMDDRHRATLLSIMKDGIPLCSMPYYPEEMDISVIEELGNILAGVYLNAVQEMSGLSTYHTVPGFRMGRGDALLDDLIFCRYERGRRVLVIENRFTIETGFTIPFFSLLAPSPQSLEALAGTLKKHELAEQ